jgi:hypothetical protein
MTAGDCNSSALSGITAYVDKNDTGFLFGDEIFALSPDASRHVWTGALPLNGWSESNNATIFVGIDFSGSAGISDLSLNNAMTLLGS